MFVLNYTPTMDPELYKKITLQAEEITGFDVSTLIHTTQGEECENYYWFE
jgi:lipocalin